MASLLVPGIISKVFRLAKDWGRPGGFIRPLSGKV